MLAKQKGLRQALWGTIYLGQRGYALCVVKDYLNDTLCSHYQTRLLLLTSFT